MMHQVVTAIPVSGLASTFSRRLHGVQDISENGQDCVPVFLGKLTNCLRIQRLYRSDLGCADHGRRRQSGSREIRNDDITSPLPVRG